MKEPIILIMFFAWKLEVKAIRLKSFIVKYNFGTFNVKGKQQAFVMSVVK